MKEITLVARKHTKPEYKEFFIDEKLFIDEEVYPRGTSPICTKITGIPISNYLPKENKFAIGGVYRTLEKGDIIVAIHNPHTYSFSEEVTNSDKFTSASEYSDSLRNSGLMVDFYKSTESMMGECMKNPDYHNQHD
jgi:hypothetical protein